MSIPISTTGEKPSSSTSPSATKSKKQNEQIINDVAYIIHKRLEEETRLCTPGQIPQVLQQHNEEFVDKTLESILNDKDMLDKLAESLSGLDIKINRIKDIEGSKYDSFQFVWSTGTEEEGDAEEGDDRFEVTVEEEDIEEETLESRGRVTGTQRGGRGGRSGRIRAARAKPRPRPEQPRSVDVSQIHTLRDVLKNITVQRIVYENWIRKKLVLVGANQPIERALSRINTHNIVSLPVVDVDSPVGAVIGLLDVLDIIASVSEAFESSAVGRPQRRELLFTYISQIMSKPNRRPTYLISTHATLHEAIHHFSQSGIQRVMIVDRSLEGVQKQEKPEEMVVGLLTQSDLIRFVAENFMWMRKEPVFQKTLGELGLGKRKPITVDQSIPAYQAFLEIHKQGREGVAMVDSSGKLVANLSASNIKGMTRRNYQLLFRSLTQYLARDRKRGWWQLPICTSLGTTLENAVLQFVASKVHRMYIVDDQGKPTGEVSMTDIMMQLRDL